jgi:hypothetical protein
MNYPPYCRNRTDAESTSTKWREYHGHHYRDITVPSRRNNMSNYKMLILNTFVVFNVISCSGNTASPLDSNVPQPTPTKAAYNGVVLNIDSAEPTVVANPIVTPSATPHGIITQPNTSLQKDAIVDRTNPSKPSITLQSTPSSDQPKSQVGERPVPTRLPPKSAPDISVMMSQMMGPTYRQTGEAPLLQNLLFQDLGPWDPTNTSFNPLRYDKRLRYTVFDDFGYLHNKGQPSQYDNPNFEFKAPADSVLIAPISGVVTMLEWQPSTSYVQDDWEIIIATSPRSKWGVGIDHITSIDCDRTGRTPIFCNAGLTINGTAIEIGTYVEAGQILGYVGNWSYDGGSGINGRTELTVFRYYDDYSGVTNYCPTDFLDAPVQDVLRATIQELMVSYETWDGDESIYNEKEMVSPGCRYSAINETNGITTPVIK